MIITNASIHQFVNSNDTLLKISHGKLVTRNRYGIRAWFSRLFSRKNYNFQNVLNFLSDHASHLKGLDSEGVKNLMAKLSTRVSHYNANHPKKPVRLTSTIEQLFAHTHSSQDAVATFLAASGHYTLEQRQEIRKLVTVAEATFNPQEVFIYRVKNNLSWGPTKADFIIKDIAPLLPKAKAPTSNASIENFLAATNKYTRPQIQEIIRLIEASQSFPFPRQEFTSLVQASTSWGASKAAYIVKDIAPLVPHSLKQNPLKQIQNLNFNVVAFYKDGLTAFLGNFFMTPFKFNGITYQCAEAAFQHQKWLKIAETNWKVAQHPAMQHFDSADGETAFKKAAELKKVYNNPVFAKEWDAGPRDQLMWEILQAKFSDPQMWQLLQATGNRFLIEHNVKVGRDTHWSDNCDGTGDNMLGLLLMAIRTGSKMPLLTAQHKAQTQEHLPEVLNFVEKQPIIN